MAKKWYLMMMMRQQLIINIQKIHPSSQNLMTMYLLVLLCLSHRKWTLRAFRRRGKRRYSYKHHHSFPLSSEYVCTNRNQTSESINKCETQMYRNWMNSLGVSPRVNYLYSGADFVLTAKSLSLSFSISSKKFDFNFS